MPDITMCMNEQCPDKDNCYRHEAEPGHWQSYSSFDHSKPEGCEHYIPLVYTTEGAAQ